MRTAKDESKVSPLEYRAVRAVCGCIRTSELVPQDVHDIVICLDCGIDTPCTAETRRAMSRPDLLSSSRAVPEEAATSLPSSSSGEGTGKHACCGCDLQQHSMMVRNSLGVSLRVLHL